MAAMRPFVYFCPSHIFHAESEDMHPESPRRVEAILTKLAPLSSADADAVQLHAYVSPALPPAVATAAAPSLRSWTLKDGDTYKTTYTDEIVKVTQHMVKEALTGLLDGTVRCGFILCRPPGHHASISGPAGFCHVNTIWTAVQTLLLCGKRKIAIYDWDVHHGDGTQDYIQYAKGEEYDQIRFVSTHAYGHGIYPGSGAYEKTDRVLSLPLRRGIWHEPFLQNFREEVLPFLQSAGPPDILLISAGYDGHEEDPMHLMNLRTETYGAMAQMLHDTLDCPVLFVLEGGYNPDALADSVLETLRPWMPVGAGNADLTPHKSAAALGSH